MLSSGYTQTLHATLFETLRLRASDGRLIVPGSPTTRSLLAYLLLNRRPIDRRRLAFTFWASVSDTAARRNLRQYLHHLRVALEPIDPEGTLLLTEGSVIQLNPSVQISLDVDDFLHLTRPTASPAELSQALNLYTGDLLLDLYDDWCIEAREQLRKRWLETLERYSHQLLLIRKNDEALKVIQKWLKAEPFDENALRQLMRIYLLEGARAKAIQAYQNFAQHLENELGTSPLPETQALLQAIQNGQKLEEIAPAPPATRTRPAITIRNPIATVPLIGRQDELNQLKTACRQAVTGSGGRFVIITGEAGIGKTRLLQEYLTVHPKDSLLFTTCYELDSMTPFAALRQALVNSPLFVNLNKTTFSPSFWAVLDSLFPNITPHALSLSTLATVWDITKIREALITLILSLVERTSQLPLHLVLDDLHWADTATWELLAVLVNLLPETPLLLIGSLRLEDLPAERWNLLRKLQHSNLCLQINLPGLTMSETAELAYHFAHSKKPEIIIKRLHQETGGNPFFIVEMMRTVEETGSLTFTDSLPRSIQRVIEARVDRLTPASREALGIAATFGRTFSFAWLQQLSGEPVENVIAFIEEWMLRGLIDENPQGYDFRHDTFRQVLYGSLSRARREYIHGKIATLLENAIPSADTPTLAYHYSRSDQPLKALPYLIQAGQNALRLRSYHEARQFGLQAVSLLGLLPGPKQRNERIDINLQLAQAYAFSGDIPRAIQILTETEHLATALGDDHRLAQTLRRAAQCFWLNGKPKLAGDYALRALHLAEKLNDSTELRYAALRMVGRVRIALSAFDDAIAHFQRYIAFQEQEVTTNLSATPSSADLSIIYGYLGIAYARVGAWQQAISVATRGLTIAQQVAATQPLTTVIFARMQLAMIYASLYRWEECLNILRDIPQPAQLEQITPPLFMALSLKGLALAQSGQTEGIAMLQCALRWADHAQHRVFHYLPRIFLAQSLMINGQPAAAALEIKTALSQIQLAEDRWAKGIALKVQAELATRLPDPDWLQIEANLIEAIDLFRQIRARPDLARTYLALRRLYDRAGQIAWAVDCHFRATTIFEELGMEDELRIAQGHPAGERQVAVVLTHLSLRGLNR